jgi:hypothetical protein
MTRRSPRILLSRRPGRPADLHDAYVQAVNAALETGDEHAARELAATYAQESATEPEARRAA